MKVEKIDRKYTYRFSSDELKEFAGQQLGEYADGPAYRGRFTDGELKGFILRHAGLQWVPPGEDAARFAGNAAYGEAGYVFPNAEGSSVFVGDSVAPEAWAGFREGHGGSAEEHSKFDWGKFDEYIIDTYGDRLTALIIERVKADIREEIEELMDEPGIHGRIPFETFRDKVLADIEAMRGQGSMAAYGKYANIEEDEGAATMKVARKAKVNAGNLERLMRERGIGISRLEAYAGVSPGTVARIFDGGHISVFDAINLSTALRATPEMVIDSPPLNFEYDLYGLEEMEEMAIAEEAEYELEL